MMGVYRVGAILLVAAGVLFAVYAKGRQDGRQAGRVEQLHDSVEAYEKRGKIDNETDALDSRAVCIRLGGLPDDCDELRRVGEAPEGE